ncbi:MAG: ParB N-terminal domain-containing protein [Anaerolineae bacterium]|nr:ParB N-terminal domain-containing protein [Anaerolineae bacterium]
MGSRRQQHISPADALAAVTAHPAENQAQLVPLKDITVDQTLQVRVDGLDEDTVMNYMSTIGNGETLPAIILYHLQDDTLLLSSGFHRLEAHKRLGVLEIAAEIREGTRRDAVEFAFEDNRGHGLPLRNKDKRAFALARLDDGTWSNLSNRELARRLGVDHKTISLWLEIHQKTTGEFSPVSRTEVIGKDGRKYDTSRIVEANRQRTKAAFEVGQVVWIAEARLVDKIITVEWVDVEWRYKMKVSTKMWLADDLEIAAGGLRPGTMTSANQPPSYRLNRTLGDLEGQRWALGEEGGLVVYQVREFVSSAHPIFWLGYTCEGGLIYSRGLSGRTWYPANAATDTQQRAAQELMPSFVPVDDEEEDWTPEEMERPDGPPYVSLEMAERGQSSATLLSGELKRANVFLGGMEGFVEQFLGVIEEYAEEWTREEAFELLDNTYALLESMLGRVDAVAESIDYPMPGKGVKGD